jgi:hypothetical protein
LNDFIVQVTGLTGMEITAEQTAVLIENATRIEAVLQCA